MDADGRVIPYVDDDQGEGIKDFIDDPNEVFERLNKQTEQLTTNLKRRETLEKGKSDSEMLEMINHKLDAILLIFGSYKLINGKWVDISKMK